VRGWLLNNEIENKIIEMSKKIFLLLTLVFPLVAYAQPNHLVYSSFLTNETSAIGPNSSCTDSHGNVYVAGIIYNASLPTNENSYDPNYNPNGNGWDGFIMQVTPDNQIGWCTYFGGERWDEIDAISCENDTLYVSMSTSSQEDITSINSVYPTRPAPLPENQVLFPHISTWSITGELIYSSFLQYPINFQSFSERFFYKNGYFYITSNGQSNYPSYYSNAVSSGMADGYFAIFDKQGNFIYDRFLGGNKAEVIEDVFVDEDYIYCSLRAYSDTSSLYPPGYIPSSNLNLVLVKINQSTKDILWTYAKSKPTGNSFHQDIFVDSNGTIYVHLSGSPSDFTPLDGQGGIQSAQITDTFFIELNSNGVPVWSSYLPSNMYEVEMLEVDYNGKLLLYSTANTLTDSPQTPDNWGYATGPSQAYYMILTPEHNIAFASYLGGNDVSEYPTSCIFNNKLYAFFSSNSSDLIVTNDQSPAAPGPTTGSSLFMHVFDDAVNIEENSRNKDAIQLFPSPTSANLTIQLPTNDNWTVRLYNMNGQVVSTEKINGNNRLNLNLQNFTSGLYTVQAMNDNGKVYTEVVVKE
jgi:hypothetical protein